MDTATDQQRDLIAKLSDSLRLRNVDPWADSLTRTAASDLIDQLQLRRISQRVNRPITVDLNNREAVRRELDRVTALDTGARDGSSRSHGRGNSGVRVTHVQPAPRPRQTASQERERRAALDRGPIGPYATGRFSESTGYGAHASYSVQRAEGLGEQRDAPAITDAQERYVIKLQEQKGKDTVVAATLEQASDEIERLKAAPGPVTPKQASYLADLQRKAGVDLEPAANRDAASAAISELREQLYGTSSALTPADAQPVTASADGSGIGAGW